MKLRLPILASAVLSMLADPCLQAQSISTARAAYVYPAGGQTGTTFDVIVGGKGINRIREVEVTGNGVTGEFVQHVNSYQQRLQEQLRIVQLKRSGREVNFKPRFPNRPDIELFTRLEDIPEDDFRVVAAKWQTKERVQRNRELAEIAVIRMTINPNARPGMREMRLVTNTGAVTNPIRFMVNTLSELKEYEPNDLTTPEASHLQLPAVMNGQVMPGDEDRFSFDAVAGQQLVVHVQARDLVPFLADAVPGWFQAVIRIEDDQGNELAYADDFQFNPDPSLLFEVPATGKYHVIIRDSIFRGREDFVYRISVGEIPFITGIYPLGAQKGTQAAVKAYGWNLFAGGFNLNTNVRTTTIKKGLLNANNTVSNYVRYEVGELPEFVEEGENDDFKNAFPVSLKSTVNGRIETRGDVDYFKFRATEGQVVKVSTMARRLYSPVDTLVRVFDGKRNLVAWNDDMPGSGNITDRTGLITHNSDSEVTFTAENTGQYFIQVTDTQDKGGETFAYRLKIEQPQPDFDLYVTPSGITIPAGGAAKAVVHVRRKNGFTGPIDLQINNKSKGLSISGGHVPENCDTIPIVIMTNRRVSGGKSGINMTATALIDGRKVVKRAIPADDITQAFITHHLVETDMLSAYILRNFRRPPDMVTEEFAQAVLSPEKAVAVPINMPRIPNGEISFELIDAPEGITMEADPGILNNHLKFITTGEVENLTEGNLVVGIFYQPRASDKNKNPRKVQVGVLPAIPYRIQ